MKSFKYDWERPYLEGTNDFILSNTFRQIEKGITQLSENGTRFEFECYDLGHLYNLAHFVDRGLIKPPFFIQCIFGITGGVGPDKENLLHMKHIADKLFGDDYYLSVLAAGRHQMPFVTMSALLGGNVRVGLEDSLYLSKGQMAPSNAAQVQKIRHILEELSLEIATPDEASPVCQHRPDGRLISNLYLAQVKKPEDSKEEWDYYNIIEKLDPDEVFITKEESSCYLWKD